MDEQVSQISDWLGPLLTILMVVCGLALWLFGRVLARVGAGLAGLALGAVAGWSAAQLAVEGPWLLGGLVLGGVIGGLLGWLLFRLWVGLGLAVILAVATPIALTTLQGPLNNTGDEPAAETEAQQAESHEPGWLSWRNEGPMEEPAASQPQADATDPTQAGGMLGQLPGEGDAMPPAVYDGIERARQWVVSQGQSAANLLAHWWQGLGTGQRRAAVFTGLIAGSLGLGMGLLMPSISAAYLTALLGSAMTLFGLFKLLHIAAPEQAAQLPTQPAVLIALLASLALAGTLVQIAIKGKEKD